MPVNKNGSLVSRTAAAAGNITNAPTPTEKVNTRSLMAGPAMPDTMRALLASMKDQLALALPKAGLDADRLSRIALTTISTNKEIQQCSAQSVLAAIVQAAQLGLEPGILGQCYLVPFKGRCQMIIGYRGMIDLARRSGLISSINAREVYTNDHFKLGYGFDDTFEHIPWHLRQDEPQTEPGDIRGFYAVVKLANGEKQVFYMTKYEVDQHRKKSPSGNSSSSPWATDYVEMGKKTVIRTAWKWLPISLDILRGVESADNSVKNEIAADMTDVIDISSSIADEKPTTDTDSQTPTAEINGQTVNTETGEIIHPAPEGQTVEQSQMFPPEGGKQ